MAFNDIPGLLNPIRRQMDRGRKLEDVWCELTRTKSSNTSAEPTGPMARPLRGLAADELAGWRPSLIFTPMMVEDGRRLLISNLDLSALTRSHGRLLMERESRRVDPLYLDDFGRSFWSDDDLLSLSAVEFCRLFPRAWDFPVSTAVRMSASFPLVSPAVSLPTLPPRRVVDAGYYDNYGVNVAAQWLIEMHEWLRANTSGILVIQIRDSISQLARTHMGFDRQTDGPVGRLERITWMAGRELIEPGLYPTNTPLEGLSTARQWSMSFRNDEQVEFFDMMLRRLDPTAGQRRFFRTVVFECPVAASLSWTLSARDKDQIHKGLGNRVEDERQEIRDFREGHRFEIDRLENNLSRGPKQPSEADKNAYRKKLKALYDQELAKLGFDSLEALSSNESRDLYDNVMNNRQRLALVKSWFEANGIECRE
jgi:hypothetical protein